MVSKEFRDALKLHSEPKHRLAWRIGITPSLLNHLIHEHQRVAAGDKRLLKIARIIGFPAEKVFEDRALDQSS